MKTQLLEPFGGRFLGVGQRFQVRVGLVEVPNALEAHGDAEAFEVRELRLHRRGIAFAKNH